MCISVCMLIVLFFFSQPTSNNVDHSQRQYIFRDWKRNETKMLCLTFYENIKTLHNYIIPYEIVYFHLSSFHQIPNFSVFGRGPYYSLIYCNLVTFFSCPVRDRRPLFMLLQKKLRIIYYIASLLRIDLILQLATFLGRH